MGILKNPKDFVQYPSFTDPNETINSSYIPDDSDLDSTAASTNNSLINQTINSQRSNTRNKRYRPSTAPKATYFNKVEGRRVRGNRHVRRHENMCYLMSLVEDSELNLDGEVTYDDIVGPQMSKFAKLMTESENLQIWTDFISRTGQEQDEIIDFAEKIINNEKKTNKKKNNISLLDDFVEYYHDRENCMNRTTGSDDDYVILNEFLREKNVNLNKRLVISESSYQKIDKHIRGILKRQVAIDMLVNYEEKLISTFSVIPDGVYISNLPTSFDRLIMHGVCQYFDLNSKSYDKDGQRNIQVENNRNKFKLPSLLLSEFIKIKFSESV